MNYITNVKILNSFSKLITALILFISCISSNSFSQSFKSLSNNEKIEWLSEVQVTKTTSNSTWPDLAIDSKGNVHIVWDDDRDSSIPPWGNHEIYYAKLDNEGHILFNDKRISRSPGPSFFPRIEIDSKDNIHIVWRDGDHGHYNDFDVYYTKIDVKGNVVIDTIVVGIGTGYIANSLFPAVALDSKDFLHIVWDEVYRFTAPDSQQYSDMRLCYTKIDTGGNILVDKLQITPPGLHVREPALAVDRDDNLQIVWVDNSSPPGHIKKWWVIRYMKLDNKGNLLVEPLQITPAWEGDSRYPSLILDKENYVHCVFNDSRENRQWDEFYTKLNSEGNTIIEDMNISQTPDGGSGRSDIALDNREFIHVVWYEFLFQDGQAKNLIYYAKLDTKGAKQISNTRVDEGNSLPERPRIDVELNGKAHIVWADDRNGNWDIYYRRSKVSSTAVKPGDSDSIEPTDICNLYQNTPNPFNFQTTFRYYLRKDSYIELNIYNLFGQLVSRLFCGKQLKGKHIIHWDTRNSSYDLLSSGIYLCHFSVKDIYEIKSSTIKMILLK